MYKLMAIDIDGTLLNSNNEVSKRTRDAINKAVKKGVQIVLTSGRMSNAIKVFSKEIGADKYLISENGASIVNLQTDEVIYKSYIEKKIVLDILDICIENNIYYMIYTDKELIVKDLKHMALYFYKQSYSYSQDEKMQTHLAGKEYIESVTDNFTKIMICDEDRTVYNSIVRKLTNINGIDVTIIPHISSKKLKVGNDETEINYSYAEIMAQNTNKWTAILKLCEELKITAEEVIAIGDNMNDMSMIKSAGLGVAMGNGTDLLKANSKFVAKSNDEDGVAEVIEKYIL